MKDEESYFKLKRKQQRIVNKLEEENPKKKVKEFMYGVTIGEEEK